MMSSKRICTLAACLTLAMLSPLQADEPATDQARDVPFTPQQVNVPPGFTVELAAGPPLIAHPSFATFDDRGRLFVCENAGVNMSAQELEEHLPNSIKLIEDTDGDGRFDKSNVFAENMTFPMGGAWHDGALYVASPPNIWRLADTDDDGVADKRDALVGKFGFTGNAASIHGCVLGPDGRLYWCDGYHGHEFKDSTGSITSKREGSYIFSCLADGSDVRIHCGGGMDNPVEVDFTDEGEMLGTVDILYTRPHVDCLVHWQYGGAYPHREQVLSELKVTGDLLEPVLRFGHVAVAGSMRYRSGVLEQGWRDNMFATFFNSGKVVRLELVRNGSSFRATQREFLSCVGHDFHPTDVVEDADGSLLIVDTGGWFYRGCPTSQYAKPDVLGAIYRVRREGQTPPKDPRGNRLDWTKQSDTALVALLGDARFAVRERAIAEAARSGTAIVPALRHTLRAGDLLARQGAVWALTRIIGGEGLQTADQNQGAGLVAAREAATALGRIGDVQSVPALLAELEHSVDRAHDHATIYALIEINRADATRTGLAADGNDTRRGALIALDQMDGGDLTVDNVLPLVAAEDAVLKRTAAEVFIRHSDWKSQSSGVINILIEHPASIERNADVLRKLVTRSLGLEAVDKLVGRLLNDTQTPANTRDLLLSAMADGRDLQLHESWIAPLEQLLNPANDRRTIERTVAVMAAIETTHFRERLNQWGADPALPALLRVAALEAAAGKPGSLTDTSLKLLSALLDGGLAESLQAAQKLGGASCTDSQLIRLAPKLASAGPSQLQELIRPFQRSQHADVAKAFLASLQHAFSLTSLAPHQFSNVIVRYPRELLPAANAILDRLRQDEQQKLVRLDAMLPLLAAGNADKGRELLFAEKSTCATCHRVAERGAKIGPDLTSIGTNRSTEDLLESILFPSATFVRDYDPYTLATVDGQVLRGMIVGETADTITIQQQIGEPVVVAREDIDQLAPSTVSVMPNGIEKILTESELADLIAYLKSLK